MIKGINNLNLNNNENSSNVNVPIYTKDEPLFDIGAEKQDLTALALEEKLASIQEENGCFLEAWDKVKSGLGVGTNSEKCEDVIEKYKNGEVSFEEAMAEIDKFDTKQDNSLNLFSNIATGVVAIGAVTAAVAATAATGGLAMPVIAAIGAGAGAVTKAGFKFTDRATNEKQNDALNGKQILKDACSGAVTGMTSAMTMGTAGSTFAAGASLSKNVANAATKCAITGVKTGAISGSANYAIDCAFDENKEFKANEFVENTIVSAAVGGAVGGIMGTSNTLLRHNGLLKSGGQACFNKQSGKAQFISKHDLAANSICTAEYKAANRGLRDAFKIA